MKNNFKRRMAQALAYLLAVCMFAAAPLSGFSDITVYAAEDNPEDSDEETAEETFWVDNLCYKKLAGNTAQLTDGTGATGEVTIPQTVTDPKSQTELTVVSVGNNAFYYNLEIEKVNFPNTVTDIGDNAFALTFNMRELTFPEHLVSIGDNAFQSCGIKCTEEFDLTLPDSLAEIGRGAFDNFQKMKSVTLPANLKRIRKDTFKGCKKLTEITFGEQLTTIDGYAFMGCTALKEIVLPNSVTELKNNVFMNCTGLTSITLPEDLTVLEQNMFSGCTSLEEVTFPKNLTRIEGSVFKGCNSLTDITIPEGVTSLSAGLFDGCIEDTLHVHVPDHLTFVHTWFCSTEYSVRPNCNITIHCASESSAARIWSIGHSNILLNGENYEPNESELRFNHGAFTYSVIDPVKKLVRIDGRISGTDRLSGELTLPEKVTNEADGVEYTLTEIGQRSFMYWRELTKVVLPDTVTHIAKDAFYGCTLLEEINMPTFLAFLGSGAFSDCPALTGTLVLPESCSEIESSVFSGTGYEEIVLPKNAAPVTMYLPVAGN